MFLIFIDQYSTGLFVSYSVKTQLHEKLDHQVRPHLSLEEAAVCADRKVLGGVEDSSKIVRYCPVYW